jgi:hypothetical protein
MQRPQRSSLSRSSSRSKRSATNLSNLRLAPLSQKFQDPPRDQTIPISLYADSDSADFRQSHSSYSLGKSAPTSPGILSRSSSRRYLGGGLSRRGSLYENDEAEHVAHEKGDLGLDGAGAGALRVDGQIPKAKSEAALQRHKLSGQAVPLRKRQQQYNHHRSRTGGTNTPRPSTTPKAFEDDWLTRTGAAAAATLQESKGQLWRSLRGSSAALTGMQDSTDDDDEGYEELAALSTSTTTRLQLADDEMSPTSTRVSRWGSRYGSRQASRRTSRRGSMTGSRTPLAGGQGQDVVAGYSEEEPLALPSEPDFVDAEEDFDSRDEAAVARLAEERSFGLGGLVDRLMGFSLFKVDEREESATEDELEAPKESAAEARERMEGENRRKREKKEKLVAHAQGSNADHDANAEADGGWKDAAWLLSLASKAMF